MKKVVSLNEITIVNRIALSDVTVSLRSDGIIYIELHPVDEISEKHVRGIIETVKNIGNGKKFPNLITTKDYVNVDKSARALAASEEGNLYTIADAIVVNSTALQLIANFYISFNKPVKPTKLFNSEEKAVEWLKTFL